MSGGKYTIFDLHESLDRASQFGFSERSVVRCSYGWGNNSESSEWHGGFVLLLKDGRWVHLTGWCDYTGWGCQDGINATFFDHEPTMKEIIASTDGYTAEDVQHGDKDPGDLQNYLDGKIDVWGHPATVKANG